MYVARGVELHVLNHEALVAEFSIVLPLFVHMRVDRFGPVANSLGEPHGEFMFGTFGTITAVANIPSQIDRVVTTDAPGF